MTRICGLTVPHTLVLSAAPINSQDRQTDFGSSPFHRRSAPTQDGATPLNDAGAGSPAMRLMLSWTTLRGCAQAN